MMILYCFLMLMIKEGGSKLKDSSLKDDVYIRKVNFYETDKMGVVHHSNYAKYLEEYRLESMERKGISYKELEDNGIIIPVLSLESQFIKPAKYDQELLIIGKVTNFTGVKFSYEYEIVYKETKELMHRAKSSHCFLNEAFQPVNIKKAFPKFYYMLFGE